jgi:radical SAM protein with 4Fe4S-binding SPASM domain
METAAAIPTRPCGPFTEHVRLAAAARRIPLCGTLELTARCNLGCSHCYINLPAEDRAARECELSLAELCRLFDELVAEGCFWLLLTGGEPLIRSDFLEVYSEAKRRGMLVTLFTNATAVTPRIADHLAEWPPYSIEVTVYGGTRETFEQVTGVRGSFDWCMRGLALLREHGLPLLLKTMVLRQNRHELDCLRALAASLGAAFRYDPVLNPRLDGSLTPLASRISAEDAVELDAGDPARLRLLRGLNAKLASAPRDATRLYQCGAGVGTFHVDSEGRLSICLLSRRPSYDLRHGTFREGWYSFIPRVLARQRSRLNACATCSLHALCGQCPASAALEVGDAEGIVEFACRLGHLRSSLLVANSDEECANGG